MRRMWFALLGVGVCLTLAPGPARAQEDEARAVIDKAIQAHGGEKALEKIKGIQVKSKGTVHQPTGELAFTSEDYWQSPDKFKNVIKATIMGKAYTEVKAFDGKKGWIQTNDVVKDFDGQVPTWGHACSPLVDGRRLVVQVGGRPGAGLVALEETPKRLFDDHCNAKFLAEGVSRIPGVRIDPAKVATNIAVFDVSETGIPPAEMRAHASARRMPPM